MKVFTSLTKPHIVAFSFTFLYIAIAVVYFLAIGDTEFVRSTLILLALTIVVLYALQYVDAPLWMLWGLSIFGLLHILGGGLVVDGDVLYGYVVLPIMNNGPDGLTFIRYDQVVHLFGAGIVALAAYQLLAFKNFPRAWRAVAAALIAMGIGSINEIFEFSSILSLSNTDVGGYYNNSLDLVFNMLGSVIAATGAYFAQGARATKD